VPATVRVEPVPVPVQLSQLLQPLVPLGATNRVGLRQRWRMRPLPPPRLCSVRLPRRIARLLQREDQRLPGTERWFGQGRQQQLQQLLRPMQHLLAPPLPPPHLDLLPGEQDNQMQQQQQQQLREDCPCPAISTHIIPDMLTSLRMVHRPRVPRVRLQHQAHQVHQVHQVYQAHQDLLHRPLRVNKLLMDIQRWSHRTRTLSFHRVDRLDIVPTQRLLFAPARRGQSLGRRRRIPSS